MSKYWQRSLIKSPYVSRHHKSWQKYPTFGRISAVEHSTLIQIYRWLRKNSTKSFRSGDLAKKSAKWDRWNEIRRSLIEEIMAKISNIWQFIRNTPQWYKFIDDFENILKNTRGLAKKLPKVQLNKYETAPNFNHISQNLTSDCLLI